LAQIIEKLAWDVVNQIVPVVIRVIQLIPADNLIVISGGLDLGLHEGQTLTIREPTDPRLRLPGKVMAKAKVTDRASNSVAACQVLLSDKARDDFFHRAERLINSGSPPEVTKQ